MALSEDEIRRISQLFDQLDYYEKQRVTSSQQSFYNWLYSVSYPIYSKVKDWLSDFWNWLLGN